MDEEAEKEGKGLSREVLSSVLEGGEKEGVGSCVQKSSPPVPCAVTRGCSALPSEDRRDSRWSERLARQRWEAPLKLPLSKAVEFS